VTQKFTEQSTQTTITGIIQVFSSDMYTGELTVSQGRNKETQTNICLGSAVRMQKWH